MKLTYIIMLTPGYLLIQQNLPSTKVTNYLERGTLPLNILKNRLSATTP